MIEVVCRNLKATEMVRTVLDSRLAQITAKFPELKGHRVRARVNRISSGGRHGYSYYTVLLFIRGKKYSDILIQKSSTSFMVAVSDLFEVLLERLNRFGDRVRVGGRKHERKIVAANKRGLMQAYSDHLLYDDDDFESYQMNA